MGLATSQVRLLALTSRKADVEMQIQLNSKRKTMLTREATELSKLYYAKLQNSRIQYSTTNGYKDVTYSYLMYNESANFFDSVINPDQSVYDLKTSSSMILTDAYGRVILSDDMLQIVLNVLNLDETPTDPSLSDRTIETMTIDAMDQLLLAYSGNSNANNPRLGTSTAAGNIYNVFHSLYDGTAWGTLPDGSGVDPNTGLDVLKYLLKNGYESGGTIYKKGNSYYKDASCNNDSLMTPQNGLFYVVKDQSYNLIMGCDNNGSMYWNNSLVPRLDKVVAQQITKLFSYYGSIFSAAFNGSKIFDKDGNGVHSVDDLVVNNFNVAAEIDKNADGDYIKVADGNVYNTLIAGDNLQEGLKSGIYQLVNVISPLTGSYAKAQGIDYFKTQNYIVEKPDSGARETITAWYNAQRADLSEKEDYWDSEITALSSELNSITTEIESVKKLREDAISSTFKWGNA